MKFSKLLIAVIIIGMIGTGYALWPRHDKLSAYHCDNLKDQPEVDRCMNHSFPSREGILAYLNDATFSQSQTGVNYSLQYFDHDGRYVTLSFGGESVPWGVAFISSGRWWLRESILPMQAGHETKAVLVRQICSLESTWTDTPRDIKDEDPDISCATMWDLNTNTFQDGNKPQIRTGGDTYALLKLYRMDSHQFHIQDFSSATPDSEIPPEELAHAAHLYESKRTMEIKK